MSSCFEISRVLPKGVQGDGGEDKTLLSAAMHLLLTSFNRVKLIHSPKNPLNSACKETIRRIDLSQIFLHRAAKLFLNALENAAQVMGLQMISRKYRQGFTRNYRSLMPSDKRLYRIDVLEAGQECHTSLWVNGIKYNLDEDVLLVNQKFRESWDVLLCELEKILRELQRQQSPTNTCDASCNLDTNSFTEWGDAYLQKDWLAILGPALLQFDKSWTYFERHYINNLICIEKRSRRIIMDCIYAEEELRLYERLYDKFLQCSPEETTMENKNTTQIDELVSIIRTAYIKFLCNVSNLQHATTFDKDSSVCYSFEKLERAFSIIQACSSHDLKTGEKYKATYRCLLSNNQCSTWIESLPQQHIIWILPAILPLVDQFQNLREILHGFSFNPERVDPYILQNVSLISLLQQMEKSWSLIMPYIENQLKLNALISFLNFLNYVLTSYYTVIKQSLLTTNTCTLENFNKSFLKNDLTKLLSFPHLLVLYSLSSFSSSVDHLCHLCQLLPTLFKEVDQYFNSVNSHACISEKTLHLQFFDLHLKLTENSVFQNILTVQQDLQATSTDFSTLFLCLLSKGSQIAQDLHTQQTSPEIFLLYIFHKSIQLMPNGNIFTPFFETCQNFMTKTHLLDDFISFFENCGNQLKHHFSNEMNSVIDIASLCFATSSFKSKLIDPKVTRLSFD
jgi:hypothetical protein